MGLRKISIALEEMGVPYEAIAIDITKDDQFAPDFLKISPNNKGACGRGLEHRGLCDLAVGGAV